MEEEKVLENAVLGYLVTPNSILLSIKMAKIGKGCWNGYGGGVDSGESLKNALAREIREESSGVEIDINAAEKVAIINFHNTKTDRTTFTCRVHVYLIKQWSGEPKTTHEMAAPTWFFNGKLPLNNMMPADRDWLPLVLDGKKVIVHAYYGPYQKMLLEPTKVDYVESFSP